MIDRSLLLAGWFFVSWLAIQTLPITALVFDPQAVEVSGDQVSVARDFPMDEYTNWRPRLSYIETVRPLTPGHNGGQSCEVDGGPFRYSSAEAVGQWSIDWAAECLDDPAGFTWSAYWHWHIGALRVGPVSLYERVLRDPCQYKVSTTGTIHGPDSPHWAQTGADRCFATRAAAEAAVEQSAGIAGPLRHWPWVLFCYAGGSLTALDHFPRSDVTRHGSLILPHSHTHARRRDMRENFDKALAAVLIHEGGFVNHPRDPGGATNKGITHKTYTAWLRVQNLPQKNVRDITDAEVAAIYREQYWNAVRGNHLPSGVDYAVFDFAVNSGPGRAARFLQRVAGVAEDGIIGQQTLAAVQSISARQIVTELCNARLAWLKRLPHWSTFGRGWDRRVNEVKAKAMRLAAEKYTYISGPEASDPAPGKADGAEKITASIKDILRNPGALTGAGAVAAPAVTAAVQGDGPFQWGLAVAVGFIGLAALVWIWRRAEK